VPAYISLLEFASQHDVSNKWFCMVTDACCPIISPDRFRTMFFENNNVSLFSWKQAWWNTMFHKRGNLAKLPKELWLANDPWFVLTKENVKQVLHFVEHQKDITYTICNGGIANETLFAVIFKMYNELSNPKAHIKCVVSHLTDWSRQSSPTSPHIFKEANDTNIQFIERELERNKYGIFIRKIAPEFPDDVLKYYIYEYNQKKDTTINHTTINHTNHLFFHVFCICFGLYVLYSCIWNIILLDNI
jgi:hypothetical protein